MIRLYFASSEMKCGPSRCFAVVMTLPTGLSAICE